MINCSDCGKENQDHYKFCLGCGARLPAPASAPHVGQPAAAPHVPAAAPVSPASANAPATNPSGAPCPSCGTVSPAGFAFCGRCGTRLPAGISASSPAPAPASAAPAPAAAAPPLGSGVPQAPARDMGSARTVFVDPSAGGSSPSPAGPSGIRLVMLGADGQPVGERLLQNEVMPVGRDAGPPWEDDAYLDPVHATLKPNREGLEIEDHRSLNGIYYRLTGQVELRDGDEFRVGQELLRYEDLPEPTSTPDRTERMGSPNPGYWGRLSVLVEPDRASKAFPMSDAAFTIGREVGELLFPEDGYVSGTHCRVTADERGVYLEDLGSSNGTYVRVRTGDVVPFHTILLIGQRLFRIEQA